MTRSTLVAAPATASGSQARPPEIRWWRSQRRAPVARLLLAAALVVGRAAAADDPIAEEPAAPAVPEEALRPSTEAEQRVVDLNEQGSRLYAAGDYRRAVELFLQAYAVDQDPNLLFNIASCYEGLGDTEAALEKYHAFLEAPNADVEGRPRAEAAIERLRKEAATASEPPAPAPPPAAPLARPSDPEPEDPGWVPWVGLGGGAALGVLGTSLYLMGAADHAQVTDADGYDDQGSVVAMTRAEAQDLVRSGNTKKRIGVITASAGGALVTGYVVWWLLHRPDTSDASDSAGRSRIDLGVSASATRLTWSGSF
jgi:tetratricopeptide repeat protein